MTNSETTPQKLLTFEDLEFGRHPNLPRGVRAYLEFENGEWISVVGGHVLLHGDGKETFEMFPSSSDDPICYCTKEEVTEEMIRLQLKFLIL